MKLSKSAPGKSDPDAFAKATVYDPASMTREAAELSMKMSALPGAQAAFLKAIRATTTFWGQARSMYAPNVRGMSSIQKPVLIVWGKQDKVTALAHGMAAAKRIRGARLKLFDRCGHLPMTEHTEEFNELLLEFLSD